MDFNKISKDMEFWFMPFIWILNDLANNKKNHTSFFLGMKIWIYFIENQAISHDE